MEDGYYFLCPKCKKLVKEMSFVIEEYNTYTISTKNAKGKPSIYWGNIVDSEMGDYFLLKHEECGFVSETLIPEDIIVKVENGRVIFIGAYWKKRGEKAILTESL
ncbi:MAG TPA: hypothetical protein ENG66_01625 [Thermococcus sp.]|nr:hypothetical protein [Thermococcus sp.]